MYQEDLIRQALFIQSENNKSFRNALNYGSCSIGTVNIVWFWFTEQSGEDIQRIKRVLSFPSNESTFKSTWWTNKFINDVLYRSRIRRYFESILQEECQTGDSNSTLFYLGSNDICKDTATKPYIARPVWRKIDRNLRRILGALFVMNYGYKMEGDNVTSDDYQRLLGVRPSERPSSSGSSGSSGSTTPGGSSSSSSSSSTRERSAEDIDFGSRSYNSNSSKFTYKDWKEIPPKLQSKFKCEEKEEISHSYTYIKEQFEKFIIDTYFKREDVYRRYDYALNFLLSRYKNGSFNFDDFWKFLAEKYGNNSEIRDILLTDVRIKCPTTASGKNIFIKISDNNNFSFVNNNSIDYDVLKTASKYSINLPSKLIKASVSFSSPEDAACLLGFNAGDTIRNYDIALKLTETNRNYRNKIDNPVCRRQYDIIFSAGIFLMNHITSSAGPFVMSRNCPPLPAFDDSMCISPSSTTSTTDSVPTTPSVPDAPPMPPLPPATPDESVEPITPSSPVPTDSPSECIAKFYDLGFIDYCALVEDPKVFKDITENLINTIRRLQFVELSNRARRADILPSLMEKADNAVDLGVQLATILTRRDR